MKNPPSVDNKFYKILTSTDNGEATILLYGFIGEEYSWDSESQSWAMTGATDIEFVKELNALQAQYPVIHIRINSPGGDMMHGNGIMAAIRNCKSEVHTWVDGIAASMAADIWLCGQRRHMARNGLLMIHPAWNFCVGHAQDMRDCAAALDKMTDSVIIATATSTGISEDDIRARYYADYKDHWLSYNDAVADGLVTDPEEDYSAATDSQKLASMTYKQLVDHFHKQSDPEAPGLMARIGQAYRNTVKRLANVGSKSITQPNPIMILDDFKKSLADGTLKLDDVQAHLAELNPAPAAVEEPKIETPAEEPAYVKQLRSEMEALKEQLTAIAAAPGASKSIPAAPATDLPTPETDTAANKVLNDFNKAAAEAAEGNDALRFIGGVRQ